VELASESEAELHLIHVVSRFRSFDEYEDAECTNAEHLAAREILDSYVKLSAIREQWIPKAVRSRLYIRQGDAADEIVRSAEQERADLIILGSQARKGWRRFLSASVADKVMRRAGCPVITI